MLVVEGPDGAGKTTLVRRLSEYLNWDIAPKVVDHNTISHVDMVQWVEFNVATGLKPIIFDRHRLLSEPIYGPLIRRKTEPGFDNLTWLRVMNHRFRSLEPMVIFCLPPFETVAKNVEDDIFNRTVARHIAPIYWSYFNVAATWGQPSLVWDYTGELTKGYTDSLVHSDFEKLSYLVSEWAKWERVT